MRWRRLCENGICRLIPRFALKQKPQAMPGSLPADAAFSISMDIRHESWPLRGRFAISRGARTTAEVVVVEVTGGGFSGRGECVPYGRYGETPDSVRDQLSAVAPRLRQGADRHVVQELLPPGAARNALDCALWDLEARRQGLPVWKLAGLRAAPEPLITAYTLSLDSPENMGAQAALHAGRPLLKLKLDGKDDPARVAAVRANAPRARIIVDANEGWTPDSLAANTAAMARLGVEMIEQPLPAAADGMLAEFSRAVPFCADESAHTRVDFPQLRGKYDMINIKLDKTGGLTEALALRDMARAAGMKVMCGCMLGTSLAMAPAALLAQGADIVDLDGPLLLAEDRDFGLSYADGLLHPPEPRLWG